LLFKGLFILFAFSCKLVVLGAFVDVKGVPLAMSVESILSKKIEKREII
jgi:hypothetical protein